MTQPEQPPYYRFSRFLRDRFGCRVYKLSLHAGFSCPNLDGEKDTAGCIFCNNRAFSRYADRGTETVKLEDQITASMEFVRKRYKVEKFIAYFQSYTNTYADVSVLRDTFGVIRNFPDIVGLAVSTRPDCVDNEKLDMIGEFTEDYMVWMEYGLQTVHDRSLEFLNRHHTFADTVNALELTRDRNIFAGAHVILGIPGENRSDMLETADAIAALPVAGVKLHCFHVVKDTRAEDMYCRKEISLMTQNEYTAAAACFLEKLPEDCVILRLVSDADSRFLIAPEWVNSKQDVIRQIEQELTRRGSYQGRCCSG